MSNRSEGTAFEGILCDTLAKNGFWAHNMAQKASGQPADVIAVKNNTAVLIDCKICSKDYFRLDRIEENQESAMNIWMMCKNYFAYFAVRLPDGSTYMVPYTDAIAKKRKGVKSLKRRDLIMYMSLTQWMMLRK